jgi:hypothetical protein
MKKVARAPAPVLELETVDPAETAASTRRRKGGRGGRRFAAQPIAGTPWSVRAASIGQTQEIFDDAADAALDDREFAVRAVQRQLLAEPALGLEDVRSWDDERLLAAARAMLSFPPLRVRVNGVEQPADPADAVVIPEPLTFASFRQALPARPKRMMTELTRRIAELGTPQMSKIFEVLRDSPAFTMKLPHLAGINEAAATALALSDTGAIARSLGNLRITTEAMERLTKPIELPVSAPLRVGPFPIYHPEVDAIDSLGERLKTVARVQATADRQQLETMTTQAELLRDQGQVIGMVVAELKGLRGDQRWPNRAIIVGAFLAGALLVVAVVAALPVIRALLDF